jgi:hypothetical protein
LPFIKKLRRNQPLFFHKPDKYHPCYQPDNGDVPAIFLFLRISRKANLLDCPEIPVGDFAVKLLSNFFNRKGFFDFFDRRQVAIAYLPEKSFIGQIFADKISKPSEVAPVPAFSEIIGID